MTYDKVRNVPHTIFKLFNVNLEKLKIIIFPTIFKDKPNRFLQKWKVETN